jgi:hypothetical protein
MRSRDEQRQDLRNYCCASPRPPTLGEKIPVTPYLGPRGAFCVSPERLFLPNVVSPEIEQGKRLRTYANTAVQAPRSPLPLIPKGNPMPPPRLGGVNPVPPRARGVRGAFCVSPETILLKQYQSTTTVVSKSSLSPNIARANG